ncbi:MAG: hypothetical protein KAU83_05260, partial [Bacteroidales bacterium]|nr:hypothetical protein [Bacteroidales bacterium]
MLHKHRLSLPLLSPPINLLNCALLSQNQILLLRDSSTHGIAVMIFMPENINCPIKPAKITKLILT